MMIVGYLITVVIWEVKLVHSPLKVFDLELSWKFTSCTVGVMAAGFFLFLRKIQSTNHKVNHICQDIATQTYGMYLVHIMILNTFHSLIDPNNKLSCGFSFVLSILTFVCSYFVIKLISFIPFSKYIIG